VSLNVQQRLFESLTEFRRISQVLTPDSGARLNEDFFKHLNLVISRAVDNVKAATDSGVLNPKQASTINDQLSRLENAAKRKNQEPQTFLALANPQILNVLDSLDKSIKSTDEAFDLAQKNFLNPITKEEFLGILNNLPDAVENKSGYSMPNALKQQLSAVGSSQNERVAACKLVGIMHEMAKVLSEATGKSKEDVLNSMSSHLVMTNEDLKIIYTKTKTTEQLNEFLKTLLNVNHDNQVIGLNSTISETYQSLATDLLVKHAAMNLSPEKHSSLCDANGKPVVLEQAAKEFVPDLILKSFENGLRFYETGITAKEFREYSGDISTHTRVFALHEEWPKNINDENLVLNLPFQGQDYKVKVTQFGSSQEMVDFGMKDASCFPSTAKHPKRAASGEFYYFGFTDEIGNNVASLTLKRSVGPANQKTGLTILGASGNSLEVIEEKAALDKEVQTGSLAELVLSTFKEQLATEKIVFGDPGSLLNKNEQHYLENLVSSASPNIHSVTSIENIAGVMPYSRLLELAGSEPKEPEFLIFSNRYAHNPEGGISENPYGLDVFANILGGTYDAVPEMPRIELTDVGNKRLIDPRTEILLNRELNTLIDLGFTQVKALNPRVPLPDLFRAYFPTAEASKGSLTVFKSGITPLAGKNNNETGFDHLMQKIGLDKIAEDIYQNLYK
jgi:hypothetical protein